MALRVWLPLNGNLNNYGLSDIDFTLYSGGNFILSNDGKIGKCYLRNYLKHLTEDFLGNTWTVAFWVKNTNTWATYNDILFCKNTDSSEDCLMYISIINGNIFNAVVNAGSTGATYSYTFSTNTWYHLAVSYNGLQICMYINGVLVKTQERVSEQSKGHLNLGIGCRSINSIGTSYTGGGIHFNDVRIYDHALSPKEVYELSKGLIIHYKLNDLNNLIYFDLTNDNYTLTNYMNRTSSYISNGIYHVEGAQQSTSIDTSFVIRSNDYITLEPNSNYYLTFLCNCLSTASIIFDDNQLAYTCLIDIDGTYFKPQESVNIGTLYSGVVLLKITTGSSTKYKISIGFDFPNLYGVGSFFEVNNVALYKIDSVVYDCSGYQNNGTITGEFSILPDSKRYNSSIKYLNSDTSIAIGNLSQLCPAGIFTFNIWFKKNTGEWSTKIWETILGGPSGFELETKISSSSSSYIHPYSWGGNSSGAPNNYSIPYTLDEWHMLTMVRTSSYSKFYLDGKLKVTGSAGSIPSGNYFLGAWYTATQQNYRGYLSDFRIYATELSESDILSLYQTSASIDNQQNFYSYEIEDNSTEYSGGLINSGEIFDLTFRATNNGLNVLKDIGTGLAHLQSVKGNTVSWNQLMKNPTMQNSHSDWRCGWNIVSETDSVITLNRVNGAIGFHTHVRSIIGHKYYVSFRMKIDDDGGSDTPSIGVVFYAGRSVSGNLTLGQFGIIRKITQASAVDYIGFSFYPNINIRATIDKTYGVNVFDLTLIYGAGNEPTSVEQFEADYQKWFGKPLTYEPYNAGELIPVKTTALKTTGFNQWDEEWEVGYLDSNGVPSLATNQIRAKNYIPAFENTGYKIYCSSTTANQFDIYFYDVNKNMIPYTGVGAYKNGYNGSAGLFITPSGTAFMRFRTTTVYGATYNNDICINISCTLNGTYKPYESHTLQLPITTLTGKLNGTGESVVVFTDGMKKAGSVQDEIYISGGKTYAIKRVGSVDLGSLSWIRRLPPNRTNYHFYSAIPTLRGSYPYVGLCANYTIASTQYGDSDKTYNYAGYFMANQVNFIDNSYTDATTFKNAMQGVMLYYELAEPLVYELDDFTLPQTFRVNDWGTEEQISNTTSIPAELLISYDIKDKISLIGNETIYGDIVPIESGTYNYSYKYEVVGSNNSFLIGLEYYDTNRNLLSTANQVSSTGALSEKVTSGNVSIPANTKYVRYKIVNDANNNSASNTSTIYFISLRLDTANPLLIYSTGESICNEFIELDQTSIHDSGITETNNIYEI